jgi:deazaflavin-dependent oxidoreductase (nitroreductase family)
MTMPAPETLRHFTSRFFNPVSRPLMGHLPGCGLVEHIGRRSGITHRTPVNIYRADGSYAIALTFGPTVQWAQNVLAAGGCNVQTRGRTIRLENPRIVEDPSHWLVPRPMRTIQRLLEIDEYLVLEFGG